MMGQYARHTGPNMQDIKLKISGDIREVLDWTRKWRINVSVEKSEFCIFSTKKIAESDKTLLVDNNTFKYNSNPNIPGVTMDEKLTFASHINQVERKSSAALKTIREIKRTGQNITL